MFEVYIYLIRSKQRTSDVRSLARTMATNIRILFMLVVNINILRGTANDKTNLHLVKQLSNLYQYESVTLVLEAESLDVNARDFLKSEELRVQVLQKPKSIESISKYLTNVNSALILLRKDNETLDLLEKLSRVKVECGVFVLTANISEMAERFGRFLRFDSNFNFLYERENGVTEIHEIYSIATGSETLIVSSQFGVYMNRKLTIDVIHQWDRRKDLQGVHFRFDMKVENLK